MKRGLIADAHGNPLGLMAVIDALKARNVDDIYFLGDWAGYGPCPDECLDIIRRECSVVLLGNHDKALYDDGLLADFTSLAQTAIEWTRTRLSSTRPDVVSYLKTLSSVREEGDIQYCHGSPYDPLHEYIFPGDYDNSQMMLRIFTRVKKGAFVSHTHIPGIFIDWEGVTSFHSPEDCNSRYELTGVTKFVVNIGSCGQPRDYNPEACCCLYDEESIEWIRVPYDIDEMARRFAEVPELPVKLATRLSEGR